MWWRRDWTTSSLCEVGCATRPEQCPAGHPASGTLAGMTDRPALVRVEQSVDGRDARVVITLAWRDREYLGEAVGSHDEAARARLLGEATLRAVEALTPDHAHLALDAIASTSLGTSRIAMAQVHTGTGDALVGSALIREDDRSAAPVRAVLDAINRKLSLVP